MRTFVLVAVMAGLALAMAPSAMACGGHESRAADCLSKLFGDNLKDVNLTLSDHKVTATLSDGSSASGHGTEQMITDAIAQFLLDHGIQQTSNDPCDSTSNAKNVFEDADLGC